MVRQTAGVLIIEASGIWMNTVVGASPVRSLVLNPSPETNFA